MTAPPHSNIVIPIVSDVHAGSALAPCPPEGVRLDDGQVVMPSKVQGWEWECWWDYWDRVAAVRKEHDAELWPVLNGDLFEGAHHGTTQIMSAHPDAERYIADRVYGVIQDLEPERVYVVRGTRAHVGPGGDKEELLARSFFKAEEDPTTKNASWWRLLLEVHGLLLDFQHHPGTHGTRPHTRAAGMSRLAKFIWDEFKLRDLRAPDVAVRSHFHTWGDSGDAFPTRAIMTPSWQVKSEFAHRVVPEVLTDIGGVILVIEPTGKYSVEKVLYEVDLPDPVRYP